MPPATTCGTSTGGPTRAPTSSLVRVYREEIQPRVELLVGHVALDGRGAREGAAAVDLAVFFARCAQAEGQRVSVIALGDEPRIVAPEELGGQGLELAGRLPLFEAVRAAGPLLRPFAQRIVVSDFLSPFDAAALVRSLSSRSGPLTLVQLLGPSDVEPPPGRALRLVDAENDTTLDLVLDPETVAAYVERRERLTAELGACAARRPAPRDVRRATASVHHRPIWVGRRARAGADRRAGLDGVEGRLHGAGYGASCNNPPSPRRRPLEESSHDRRGRPSQVRLRVPGPRPRDRRGRESDARQPA